MWYRNVMSAVDLVALEALAIDDETIVPVELGELEAVAREIESHFRSKNTRRAYRSALMDVTRWCRVHGKVSLPMEPEAIRLYLAWCADARYLRRRTVRNGIETIEVVDGRLRLPSLQVRLAAITMAHRLAGIDPLPTDARVVQNFWDSLRRKYGHGEYGERSKVRRKDAMVESDLRLLLREMGESASDVRDRALLLLGFLGGFRRAELAAFDVDDVRFVSEGLEVNISSSKTDQYGEGQWVGIAGYHDVAVDPVRALRRHYEVNGVTEGKIFRGLSNAWNKQ